MMVTSNQLNIVITLNALNFEIQRIYCSKNRDFTPLNCQLLFIKVCDMTKADAYEDISDIGPATFIVFTYSLSKQI